MSQIPRSRKRGTAVSVSALLLSIMCACSTLDSSPGQSADSPGDLRNQGPSPLYHDFGDVLVPSELKVDRKASFSYRTPGFSAGILALKGRVEVNSLVTFFENNMAKDNWRLLSSFKSPRSLMLFHKKNRWSVITISEGDFTTYVEIWVSPTVNETDVELLN